MLSAVSPAFRGSALADPGLKLAHTQISVDSAGLNLLIRSEHLVPPLEWWNYGGHVTIESSNAPLAACAFVEMIKSSWPRSTIRSVHLHHDDEVGEEAQKAILRTLHTACGDLVELHLENYYLYPEDKPPLLPSLRTLYLSGLSGPIQSWTPILNGSVERVEIHDTAAFTPESFAFLKSNWWQRLVLDNSNVSDFNLSHLQCASQLKTLSLVDCRQIDSFDGSAFPKLRLLLLSRTPISSDLLTGMETCTHLHLINLGGCRAVTDINFLGGLKSIREIFVHETSVTNEGIMGLAECENLEKLNLGGCRNISNVNHLGRLPALKELHLWSTRVSNAGLRGLCGCASLTELILDDCTRVSDVATLGSLSSLRWLSLIGTEVTSQGIKDLIHCRSLETLALAGTRVEHPPKLWRHDAVVEYLSGFQ